MLKWRLATFGKRELYIIWQQLSSFYSSSRLHRCAVVLIEHVQQSWHVPVIGIIRIIFVYSFSSHTYITKPTRSYYMYISRNIGGGRDVAVVAQCCFGSPCPSMSLSVTVNIIVTCPPKCPIITYSEDVRNRYSFWKYDMISCIPPLWIYHLNWTVHSTANFGYNHTTLKIQKTEKNHKLQYYKSHFYGLTQSRT